MALTNVPVFIQTPKLAQASIGAVDVSNWKLLCTAGANGSKVTGIVVTSNDSAARVVQVALSTQATVTTPVASPGLVNWTNHNLAIGDQVNFSGGTLPTGIVANTTYFVVTAGFTPSVFEIGATAGGAAINFTGSSSGTQTGFSFRPLCSANVATLSGTDGVTAAVNLFGSLAPGLPVDSDGNPYVFLMSANNTIQVSTTTTVTANKMISVAAIQSDF